MKRLILHQPEPTAAIKVNLENHPQNETRQAPETKKKARPHNAQLKGKNQNPFTQPNLPEPQKQTEPKVARVFVPFKLFVMTAAPNRTKTSQFKE